MFPAKRPAYHPRMQRRLRTAGFGALLLAASILAFSPVLTRRYAAGDLPYLVRASPIARAYSAAVADRLAEGDGPLARGSLALSCRLWAREGMWTVFDARKIRFENLLLLLGTAAFLRLALRRALSPWAGSEGARAAAGAGALLVACHPLCAPAIAAAGARGDLLAACLGAASAALFLRGRQERRVPETVAAGAAALLAGQASAIALLLPPLLAVLELFSARRHRSLSVRLRTSATTFVVFGACVAAEAITGPLFHSPPLLARTASAVLSRVASQGVAGSARALADGLGAIALPVARAVGPGSAPAAGGAPWIYVLGAAVLLAALQPALVAARSAPRLWAWLAVVGGTGILLATWLGSSTRLVEEDLGGALASFPAALVACAGLAVASTALSGLRRVLVPAGVAIVFVVLARTEAVPLAEAGTELGMVQAGIVAARAQHGGAASYLLVDPSAKTWSERKAAAVTLLLDPAVCPSAERGDTGTVRAIAGDALLAFARQPEFAGLRREGVVLVRGAVESGELPAITAVPGHEPSSGTLTWQGNLRSDLFDVDPLERRAMRVAALSPASTGEAPRMGWRAGDEDRFSRGGVWIEGSRGPVALFDLSQSPEWLFGPRVHRVWLTSDPGKIALGELLADVPSIACPDPGARGGDWTFVVDRGTLPRPLHGEAEFVLSLLDLESLRYVELDPRAPTGSGQGEIAVTFDPPARAVSGPSPCAWSLEWRCGNVCLARASGRR